MRIVIINGPNLNLLGIREPGIYGHTSFQAYFQDIQSQFPNVELDYYQNNIEGEIINILHLEGFKAQGIILNAGGYTHTSVAIADAVAAIPAPVIEVHISNVYAREEYRHKSFISAHAMGTISGLGLDGYTLALVHLMSKSN